MNEQLSNVLDRAIAEGWKVETLLRRVNNEIGDDGEPVSVGEATNALRERGFRVIENGIRKIGEWAFSEETREKLLHLAAAGAHMDELFDAPGADVDDPSDFVEANGYAFDDDDCCVAVDVSRPKATPAAKADRKKLKLESTGLPNKITLRLAGLELRHVPGWPNVLVSKYKIAFLRQSSRRFGDHFVVLKLFRNPRTQQEAWRVPLGRRGKYQYLRVAPVMYNTGFWKEPATRRKKCLPREL